MALWACTIFFDELNRVVVQFGILSTDLFALERGYLYHRESAAAAYPRITHLLELSVTVKYFLRYCFGQARVAMLAILLILNSRPLFVAIEIELLDSRPVICEKWPVTIAQLAAMSFIIFDGHFFNELISPVLI